jgi:hypothetical protein
VENALVFAACAGIASLAPVLARWRRGVHGTALESAWRWSALAWTAWLLTSITEVLSPLSQTTQDVFWYLTAILSLTPPISVLGARRPVSRVWTWFVLLPLVLVFTWPVLAVLAQGPTGSAFTLEEPMLVAYALVLVMGAGNYFGLCWSVPAVLWMAGLLFIVLPLCPATTGWLAETQTARLCGTLLVVAAGWIADRVATKRARPAGDSQLPIDRVWQDFRDLFGIVWARRIQERFNDMAREKGVKVRLGIHGVEGASEMQPGVNFDPETLAAAESIMQWLLQKFVDPEWIRLRFCTASPHNGPDDKCS